MTTNYDTRDPPTGDTEEVDLGEVKFENIPLCTGHDNSMDTQKKPIAIFAKEVIPVITTPRYQPVYFDTEKADTSRLYAFILKLATIELVLSGIPVLVKLYGGTNYAEEAYTFWGGACGFIHTGTVFTAALLICAITNAACLFVRPMWFPDTTWIKIAFMAAAISWVTLHRSGDYRIDMAIPAGLLMGLVFTFPIHTKRVSALAYPVGCFLAFSFYVVVYKVAYCIAYGTQNIYLDIGQVTVAIVLPLSTCLVPLVMALNESYSTTTTTTTSTDVYYLFAELIMALAAVAAILVPTHL
jgi:hypothetical protein